MKIAIVAFVLTLVLVVGNCSIPHWPWYTELATHGHKLSYTAVSSPVYNPVVWDVHAPAGVVATAHAISSHAPVVWTALPNEASYVAKTLGAVHTAPLAGHVNSVANINVAPAPGVV